MGFEDTLQREEEYRKYYDHREAQLQELGQMLERLQMPSEQASDDEIDRYYERVGRLKARLSDTRDRLEKLKTTADSWPEIRKEIDEAISDLESAIAEAGPRFQ